MRVASTRFIGGWENDARIISVLLSRYDVEIVWYETGRLCEDGELVGRDPRALAAIKVLSSEPNSRNESNILAIVGVSTMR